jgi:hypothetical protein
MQIQLVHLSSPFPSSSFWLEPSTVLILFSAPMQTTSICTMCQAQYRADAAGWRGVIVHDRCY